MKKNLVTNKAKQIKAAVIASVFGLSITAGAAHAYLEVQNFVGATTDSGGILTFQDSGQQLIITIDNTSSYDALITGAVFNIAEDVTSATIASFTDGDGNSILSLWEIGLDVDNNTTPSNTTFDLVFNTINGVNGGIFNDGVATNTANAFPDIATLVLNISSPDPWNFTDVLDDSILRTQRTGADGQGSDKITTSSSSSTSGGTSSGNQVSEPTILALLGVGLLGQALVLRNRRRLAL